MYKITVLILLLPLLLLPVYGREQGNGPQAGMNTLEVDRQTHALLMEEDWSGLTELGEAALRQGIDYYFLRYRLGIAWYNRQNYHRAVRHLRQAWEQTPGDERLLEYLYYSMVYAGRDFEARHLAHRFSASRRQELRIYPGKPVQRLLLTFDMGSQDNDHILSGFSVDPEAADGSQFLSRSHRGMQLGLLHPAGRSLSVYHAYTHIRKEHFAYFLSDGIESLNARSRSELNQYYFSVIWRLAADLRLVAGVHYLHIRLPATNEQVPATNEQVPGMQEVVAIPAASMNDVTGSLSLYRDFTYFTLGLSGHAARLNSGRQWQGDLLAAVYPLGNQHLYSVSVVSLQHEEGPGGGTADRLVFQQRLGVRATSRLWLEASAGLGDMSNFIRYDGALVYNAMDEVTRQLGFRATLEAWPDLGVFVAGYMTRHRSRFMPAGGEEPENPFTYSGQTFTGGITWSF
jgi:hypothetical protein